MRQYFVIYSVLLLFISPTFVLAQEETASRDPIAPGLKYVDAYTIAGEKNFLKDIEPLAADGDLNVVVEIPTGTIAKWEVTQPDGAIRWEFKNDKPRIVKYLGYPGNYCTVPRTLLPKEFGGDGDPLDILVLGPAVPRGTVVKAKLIGVLKLWDGGEQDDKLVAVMADSPLYEAKSIKELDEKFPGVTTIIKTWFVNYKGPGEIESRGYGELTEAKAILDASIKAFEEFTIAP